MGITAEYDRFRVDQLTVLQHGVVARGQLLECGMTRSAIQYRVGPGGPWCILLPGIYAIDAHITTERREMAALLHSGPDGIITGPYAVRKHGLRASGPTSVDVLVPPGTRRFSSGFVRLIRTSRMPGTIWDAGPLRFADPVRAVADAVRGYRDIGEARAVICAALDRHCTVEELRTELISGPVQGSALLRRALRDAAHGIWSKAEGDFLELIKRSGLPEPVFNVAIYDENGTLLGIIDAWWDRACVGAEVDSSQYHSLDSDWLRTLDRHNRLTSRIRLLHFAPSKIGADPAGVVSELRTAIDDGYRQPIRAVQGGAR